MLLLNNRKKTKEKNQGKGQKKILTVIYLLLPIKVTKKKVKRLFAEIIFSRSCYYFK